MAALRARRGGVATALAFVRRSFGEPEVIPLTAAVASALGMAAWCATLNLTSNPDVYVDKARRQQSLPCGDPDDAGQRVRHAELVQQYTTNLARVRFAHKKATIFPHPYDDDVA